MSFRIGADIGGTFTDVVLVGPDGATRTRKVASTPDDYSRGILDGVSRLLSDLGAHGADVAEVIHGTTVATNAILEYKGARTGLLTTRGFRDVLELRRVRAPELYNVAWQKPKPLVERRLRLEVDERTAASGTVIAPLDESSVRLAVERLAAERVEAIAVCLLHSYKNPAHERRVGEIVREMLPDVYLSLSVDVLPEVREYERASTTVINAYIGPIVRSYMRSLLSRLESADVRASLLIMQSNGGVMSAISASERPAAIVESGPAAGLIASHRLSQRLGAQNLITLDMGGTTAKASMIEDGKLTQTTEYEVGAGISLTSRLVKGGGHALKLPVLDIAEVGAGGGSIVWVDQGGGLRVGPHSAGAVPGPACYAAGGTEPTLTDANVVLGYLNPRGLAGGSLKLVPERAREAIETRLAGPLGMDVLQAAYGAYTVAVASMQRAVKAVSTYRGRDPRDFVLLAFGGSGPVFAAAMAESLGMHRVIIPPAAGLCSAVGLLEADLEHAVVQTYLAPADGVATDGLNRVFLDLEARAHQAIEADTSERFADLRYSGQAFELTVPVPSKVLRESDMRELVERFAQEHERTYGHRAQDEPVEIVNARVTARIAVPRVRYTHVEGPPVTPAQSRRAYFGPQLGLLVTPVVARRELAPSRRGPIIVEEYDATTLVPPGWQAQLDEADNIILDDGRHAL